MWTVASLESVPVSSCGATDNTGAGLSWMPIHFLALGVCPNVPSVFKAGFSVGVWGGGGESAGPLPQAQLGTHRDQTRP